MFSKIPYYTVDIIVKILTLNLYVIKRLITPYTGIGKVLDLGCGVGSLAPLFKRKNYLGIDIDKKSIEFARKKNLRYKFQVADVTDFQFNDKFDLILIVGVLHHLNNGDVRKTLEGVSNCLKKDGKLIVIEAIPPIFKWNLPGQFLRANDNGKFIRLTEEYKSLIEIKFYIKICKSALGGFFDYAFVVGTN